MTVFDIDIICNVWMILCLIYQIDWKFMLTA
jgi:hypothetical protein